MTTLDEPDLPAGCECSICATCQRDKPAPYDHCPTARETACREAIPQHRLRLLFFVDLVSCFLPFTLFQLPSERGLYPQKTKLASHSSNEVYKPKTKLNQLPGSRLEQPSISILSNLTALPLPGLADGLLLGSTARLALGDVPSLLAQRCQYTAARHFLAKSPQQAIL